MKTKKIIATLIAVVLLTTLSGCENVEEVGSSSDYENAREESSNEYKESEESDKIFEESCNEVASVEILGNNRTNFKSEIINEIEKSKTLTRNDNNYGTYSANRIPEIKEFYYPKIEIEGYELFVVHLTKFSIMYYYAPGEKLKKEEEFIPWQMYDDSINVLIRRPDSKNAHNAHDDSLEKIAEANAHNGMVLTVDNLLYYRDGDNVRGQVGEVNFRITVPEHLADYEYLRDLAFDVIKNAELVTVKD
ncbi:MAG: hypothetical protein FWG83_03120 [Oscillospiraceae bacterium]|nr:hypothetical protein [Oscillospiraceae bacterium]